MICKSATSVKCFRLGMLVLLLRRCICAQGFVTHVAAISECSGNTTLLWQKTTTLLVFFDIFICYRIACFSYAY